MAAISDTPAEPEPFGVDRDGNLDVSRFGPRLAGAGGFITISQNARKVVLTGTFMSGHLRIAVDGGRPRILEEGECRTFVEQVEHRIFGAAPMGLRDDLLRLPLDRRFTYDPQQNLFVEHFPAKWPPVRRRKCSRPRLRGDERNSGLIHRHRKML